MVINCHVFWGLRMFSYINSINQQLKKMKKSITLLFASIIAITLMSFSILNGNGISGYSTTGCGTTNSCHVGASNSNVVIALTFTPALPAPNTYIPGVQYSVAFNIAWPTATQRRFGLDLSTNLGTLNSSANTQLLSGEIVQTTNFSNTAINNKTFNFTWTAPSTGLVTLNYAALTGMTSTPGAGDHWAIGTYSLSTSVDVSESDRNIKVAIYPNPILESFNVSYNVADNSLVKLELLTIDGKLVKSILNKTQSGNQIINIPIDDSIPAGIYFINISINGIDNYKKIIVDEN